MIARRQLHLCAIGVDILYARGVEQVHTGFELDFNWRLLDNLRLNGFLSIGNWEYNGDAEADIYDDSQNLVGTATLYLDGVKVGDAAQTTGGLGVNYTFLKNFNAGLNWRYAAELYADIDVTDFDDPDHQGSLKLPSYNLVDARLSYNWKMSGGNSLEFSVNVNNLFDEFYISESETNRHAGPDDDTWNGINTRNRVYFGFGTTWNTSIRFRF